MNDLIILSMMLDGPKHGYQLKHEAGMIFGQQALHNNIVYPLLRRFLNEGWVTKTEVPGERGQTRQQYSLTAQGRRTLLERLNQFSDSEGASEDGFRFRVALFPLLEPSARERLLQVREKHLQSVDQRMAALEKISQLEKYPREAIRQIREHIALEVKWIPRLRRLMKSDRTNHKSGRSK